MTGHLFLGGPVHGETHDLPGRPKRWEFAVFDEKPVTSWRASEELEESFTAVDRFVYEPMVVRRNDPPGTQCTVYVPAHMSEDAQWEMVKALWLGEVPAG